MSISKSCLQQQMLSRTQCKKDNQAKSILQRQLLQVMAPDMDESALVLCYLLLTTKAQAVFGNICLQTAYLRQYLPNYTTKYVECTGYCKVRYELLLQRLYFCHWYTHYRFTIVRFDVAPLQQFIKVSPIDILRLIVTYPMSQET